MSERAQSAAPDGPSHGWCRCIQIDLRGAKVALLVVLLCSTHVVCAQNPCAAIRQLCENAGFVQGAAESGNGLQRDCIQPIMQASAPPNHSSRPLPAVDPQLVEACKAARPDFGQTPGPPASTNAATARDGARADAGPSTARGPTLTYLTGSTHKINQLIGELDRQTHQPTLSRTESRYRLQGTDLGYSFEHRGKIYFLFGDTVGALDRALDSVATTAADRYLSRGGRHGHR